MLSNKPIQLPVAPFAGLPTLGCRLAADIGSYSEGPAAGQLQLLGKALGGGVSAIGHERTQEIAEATTSVVRHLVSGEFGELEALTSGRRLSAGEIHQAIREYGRTLIMPPPGALADLNVVVVTGAKPVRWSVVCDLWTQEEGRSDLSLELTLIDQGRSDLVVEIDNIHVL